MDLGVVNYNLDPIFPAFCAIKNEKKTYWV